MSRPILSICIPTYNRCELLAKTIETIINSKSFLNTNDVEIVISNNCSNDDTDIICKRFIDMFPSKIKYVKQKKTIFADENIFKTIEYAAGLYCKLNNDTCGWKDGALDKFIEYLKMNDEDCIFLSDKKTSNLTRVLTLNDFIKNVSYHSTWIGSFCIKKDVFETIHNPLECAKLKLPQVDIYGKLFKQGFSILIWEDGFFDVAPVPKKGGDYNIAEVFGKNYFTILSKYKDQKKGISSKTFNREKNNIINFINFYYFDRHNQLNFNKNGYFKHMLAYYKFNPCFYFNYLIYILKLILNFNFFVKIEKTSTHRKYKILGLIKFKIRRKSAKKSAWQQRNGHNHTWLVNTFQSEKIEVGKATYGPIDAAFSSAGNEKLIIGNFCSIASGVKFIVASEHPYKGLSTYPFKVYYLGDKLEAGSKGSIVVGDDVWIATNAIILSGVTIGQGAIIGAGAVVTKDVPPYAIVGGNPAKVIKYRFQPEVIEKLLKFDFSKLTEEKIKKIGTRLYVEITEDNVDNLIREFQE